jgi:hypothetical protein
MMFVGSQTELKSLPAVALVREEGTNGDRELAAAFYMAGFEVPSALCID